MGEDDVESVLGNLDFREKGGYTRDIIEVTPVEAGRPAVRALPCFISQEEASRGAGVIAAARDSP